jgi:hypothetical protein
MFNEFELNESMLDEDELETPKKKGSEWLTDEEIEEEETKPESDDDDEEEEAEEEPPV